jgi:imidazolonepropionase-like amidohydrolase
MGGDAHLLEAYRQRILEQPTAGPIIHGAGPILDGTPPVFADFSLPLNSDSPIEAILDGLGSLDVDFFKVYSLLDSASLHRIAQYADAHAIPFAGHLSEHVDPHWSIEWGQASIEHLNRLEELWPTKKEQLASLVDLMRSKGTFLCPTTVIYQKKAVMNDSLSIWRMEDNGFIPPLLLSEWQQSRDGRLERYPESADWERLEERFDEQRDLINYLHQAGVPILAGSDFAGMPFVYPGYGLHEELALLVEAGLSPLEALQSATIQPARFFGLSDRYGLVKEGYQADLLLLQANPLENIRHSLSIVEVVRAGKLVQK